MEPYRRGEAMQMLVRAKREPSARQNRSGREVWAPGVRAGAAEVAMPPVADQAVPAGDAGRTWVHAEMHSEARSPIRRGKSPGLFFAEAVRAEQIVSPWSRPRDL